MGSQAGDLPTRRLLFTAQVYCFYAKFQKWPMENRVSRSGIDDVDYMISLEKEFSMLKLLYVENDGSTSSRKATLESK